MENKEEINKESDFIPLKDVQDWKDLYVRLYADFDNYKKRVNKEKEEIRKNTKVETLASILEVDNDIHLALNMIKDPKSLQSIQLVADKLTKYLKSQGIEEIPTDTYDEDKHEVISLVESDKSGIVSVVSKGYTLNGQIFKYPKVIIAK